MKMELESNPTEPRRGIAPFAEGIKKEVNPSFRIIRSKPTLLRDLGEMTLVLRSPQKQTLNYHLLNLQLLKNDQAFTIDRSGETKRGKLLHFLKKGYYYVDVEIDPQQPVKPDQDLDVNIWIEDGESPIKAPLRAIRGAKLGTSFIRTFEDGTTEQFVLPSNPQILKQLKLNVATQ